MNREIISLYGNHELYEKYGITSDTVRKINEKFSGLENISHKDPATWADAAVHMPYVREIDTTQYDRLAKLSYLLI